MCPFPRSGDMWRSACRHGPRSQVWYENRVVFKKFQFMYTRTPTRTWRSAETITRPLQVSSSSIWVFSQILAQVQLKRETWWAGGAMAAMTCMTRSGGSWFSSAAQTTQMEATGCASTASFAYTAGSTSWLAERTRLAGVSSSGSSTAGADTKPSLTQVIITDSDFQHMVPTSDAVAAPNG